MTEPHPRLSGRAKFLVDFGPLAVFFIAYFLGDRLTGLAGAAIGREWCLKDGGEMFLAVAAFLPVFVAGFAYSVAKERRVAPMLLVSGVLILVLGGLTLTLQNKTFFYMKPTIVYVLFGGALIAGLLTGRNFLKLLFDGALRLTETAWRTLTIRYATFFFILAILNEVAWRWLTRDCAGGEAIAEAVGGLFLGPCGASHGAPCAGEAAWVNLKIFGFTLLNFAFIATQAPLILKSQAPEAPEPLDPTP